MRKCLLSQNSVYMNGATAEPCASTISTPRRAIITKIGHNQYFFRVRMNAHSSLSISIAIFLKLVGHGIRWRPGRLARYPVRVRAGIELQAQRILPGEPSQHTDRSDDAIKQNAQCNRTHDLPQQKSELEPQPIRYGKERWLPDGDYGENNCYT